MEAVDHGEGLGAAYLGNMEYFGDVGPIDRREAERWFERGVKLHDGLSAYDLACLYSAGPEHEHDLRKATELMRFAAKRGYVRAMSALSVLLLQNPDLAETPNEPLGFLERASGAGNPDASMMLGVLARDGRLVNVDPGRAFYYFRLAALQGGPVVQKKVDIDLNALAHKLPAGEQHARSGQAESWMRTHQVRPAYLLKDSQLEQQFPLNALAEPSREDTGE
jgi:TPR repeat protein